MSDRPESHTPARSSRQRYHDFVRDYKHRRLDEAIEALEAGKAPVPEKKAPRPRGDRRRYLRQYLHRLRPHRPAVAAVFVYALVVAGLEMIEPLFLRFIVDRVLLDPVPDTETRLFRLQLAGAAFLGVVVLSKLVGALKDYRQRILNVRVMLTLRRALYDRFLHLPLPRLWEMKTGGILSRLSGDIDTTTGLLQMAVVSPALSLVRLTIALGVLLALNWRLALGAMAVIPGAVLMSFVFSSRVRPIYRAVRKDVELLDGRAGETFAGIRVVRAFGRERRELLDYLRGRHTVLRKELFAHRRELVLWGSWGLLVSGVNVVIVWYGGYLAVTGRASVGDIMAFQWYMFLLLNPVWNIVNSFSELQRVAGGDGAGVRGVGGRRGQAGPARRGGRSGGGERDSAGERGVRVPRGPAGGAGLQRGGAGRVGGGAGRPERSRQDDGDGPGGPVPRPDPRPGAGERHRHPRLPAAVVPRPAGPGAAGRVPVRRVRAGQHRLRPGRRHVRRGGRRRPAGQRPRVHRQAAGRVRHAGRRAGGEAVRRATTAAGHRSCHPEVAADSDSGTRRRATWTRRANSSSRRRWRRCWPGGPRS